MNQREIKFRIWGDGQMDYSPETYTGWLNDNFTFDGYVKGTEPVVMQFTGLKDKNGKEIYEGDIIREKWGGKGNKNVMKWMGNGFWLERENGEKYLPNDMEIIGNIYENPDLLQEITKEK